MAIDILLFIVILVLSVVIHEVAHGYAAQALGDPTAKLAGRLTLNPFKHLDWLGSLIIPGLLILANTGFVVGWAKPVPYNPHQLRGGKWGPALVAAAGPAVNLALALIFAVLAQALVFISPVMAVVAGLIILVNLNLAVFNLIPIVPLDGSKILLALLPYRYRHWEEFFYRYQLVFLVAVIIFISNTNILSRVVSFLFQLLHF
jgi:Zn-dependent protease